MSNPFVADSSVGVAWAVLSQSSPSTDRLLDEVATGRTFVVPSLWLYEVSNALLVLKRRRRISDDQAGRARSSLGRLMPVLDDAGPPLALGRIFGLAGEHGLSVYDAAYLEVALRRRLPLASCDTAMNAGARRCGLKVLL